jgi:hypothetical protein
MPLSLDKTNTLLNFIYKNKTAEFPNEIWLGLLNNQNIELNSSENEGYQRVKLEPSQLNNTNNNIIKNNQVISFNEAINNWQVAKLGFWTVQIGGEPFQIADLKNTVIINNNEILKFINDSIQIKITNIKNGYWLNNRFISENLPKFKDKTLNISNSYGGFELNESNALESEIEIEL